MSGNSSEDSFKVTDRRRRADTEQAPAAEPPPPVEPAPEPPRPELDPSRSLAGLFVMFASSALVALGESPDPITGQAHRDLSQASEAIDVLTLLRAKTEGNRTPEETELLEQIIYDLQLRFVRATAPSGPAGDRPPR